MVGFPFLREAFLFGIVLYIWGMKKVLIHVGFLSALLIINTLCFAFIGTGYIGKAVLLFLSSGVLAYGYLKTFEKDTPAWWDGVHEMD